MNTKYNIEFRIISSPVRKEYFNNTIIPRLNNENVKCFYDINYKGPLWNHVRANSYPADMDTEYICCLEDDVIIPNNFIENLNKYIFNHQDDFCSLYTGTGRPKLLQREIDAVYKRLPKPITPDMYFEWNRLFHAVGYVYPASYQGFLRLPDNYKDLAADRYIGDMWIKRTGKNIIFPIMSLVDHNDDKPVKDDVREYIPRHARMLMK